MLMNASMVFTCVMRMPPVAIPMAVTHVIVSVDGLVMESIAQVRLWVTLGTYKYY